MQIISSNPKYCGFCPDIAQGSAFLCFCLHRGWKFALYAVMEHVALYFAISGADFLYFWEIWHVYTRIFFLLESCRYHQTIMALGFNCHCCLHPGLPGFIAAQQHFSLDIPWQKWVKVEISINQSILNPRGKPRQSRAISGERERNIIKTLRFTKYHSLFPLQGAQRKTIFVHVLVLLLSLYVVINDTLYFL